MKIRWAVEKIIDHVPKKSPSGNMLVGGGTETITTYKEVLQYLEEGMDDNGNYYCEWTDVPKVFLK